MKVYILSDDDWEDNIVIGVFSTQEKAEKYLSEHMDEFHKVYGHPRYGFNIYDMEVDSLLKGE